MSKKIKVGLIYGGKSGEHDVSLQTALAVIKAFDQSKYDIMPFYITKQGEWRAGAQIEGTVDRLDLLTFSEQKEGISANALSSLFERTLQLKARTGVSDGTDISADEYAPIDVIFPLLHGTFGEDGTIQGLLEMANIPYVGAGVLASAVGMDKVFMKKVFAEEGLPQCKYRHCTRTEWRRNSSRFIKEIEVALGYPCFVKPANLGSSVGISKANHQDDLMQAIEEAFRYDRKVIVEEAVDAREIEIGVLGNDDPKASVPGEVVSSSDFYDYRAKYMDGKSSMIIPADLDPDRVQELREMAVRAFRAVDGSGLSRVDFFIRSSDGKMMINEINTMPGFTPFSMYPLLWQETGVSYQELLDELISLAMQRHAEKQEIDYGFSAE